MFIRLRNRSERFNTLLNSCGIAALLLLLLLYRALGVDVNLYRSDIIILILANVVVAGSFLWWLTRRKPGLRMGLVALLVALKLSAAVPGSWKMGVSFSHSAVSGRGAGIDHRDSVLRARGMCGTERTGSCRTDA